MSFVSIARLLTLTSAVFLFANRGIAQETAPEGPPFAHEYAPYPMPPPPQSVQTAPQPVDAAPDPEDVPPKAGEPLGTYQSHWMGLLGVRAGLIGHEGMDPFSENDALVQVSLGGGRTLFASGDLSLAAVGFWDYGERRAEARGEATHLAVQRLTLGPEARYHLLPQLYAFGRVAPGAVRTAAELDDSVSLTKLEATSWTFALDATLGGAYQLWGKKSGHSKKPRVWLIAEGGYGWATESDLRLAASSDTAPQRVAELDLGTLAVRGPTFRVSGAITF
jgi:hypothetical protein